MWICSARGISVEPGKGSHHKFKGRSTRGTPASYTIPRDSEVPRQYIRGLRKAFGLTVDDGVSDTEFYGD